MSGYDDKPERIRKDNQRHQDQDWDRKDDARKTIRELERLRIGLEIMAPFPGETDDERTSGISYETLLKEKAKLLKEIATTLEAGEQDEVYRFLNNIPLYNATAGTQFDQLMRMLEQRILAQLIEKQENSEGFNLPEILREQEQKLKRDNLSRLRVGVGFLRGIWRRYHTSGR